LYNFLEDIRQSIQENRFVSFKNEFLELYGKKK